MPTVDPNNNPVIVISGGGSVAAADITDAGATGIALIQSATDNAGRTALGLPAPTTLSTAGLILSLWGDDNTTVGASVSSWASRTGGYTAVQATGANQPVVIEGIGGRRGLIFDGSNDMLTVAHAAAFDIATPTVYVVGRLNRNSSDTLPTNTTLLSRPFNAADGSPYMEWGFFVASATTCAVRTDGTEIVSSAFPRSAEWDEPFVMALRCGSGGTSLHRNGRRIGSGGTATITYANSMPIGICGAAVTTPVSHCRAEVYAVLLYNVAHTAAERRAVEAFLSQYYALPVVASLTV